jgi:hypothetical protein
MISFALFLTLLLDFSPVPFLSRPAPAAVKWWAWIFPQTLRASAGMA